MKEWSLANAVPVGVSRSRGGSALNKLPPPPTREDIWNVCPRKSCKISCSEDVRHKDPFEKSDETRDSSFAPEKKDPLHVCIPVYMCTQTYSQTHRLAWTVEHILELQLATHGASRCPRCVMGLGTFHHRKPESPHLSPSSQPPLEVTQCVLKIQQQKWFPSWAVLSCFFPSYSIII